MKKRSFNKNFMRTISRSKARFLSILAIIAIGVGFFAGINATEPDMILSADKYYKDNNLSDLRIVSPIGFSEEDIRKVMQTEGIDKVQEGHSKDLFLTSQEGSTSTVKLFSYNAADYKDGEGLNEPVLIDGRMPEKTGEIVVEHGVNASDNIKIGSKVVLSVPDGEQLDEYLRTDTFVVVGIADSPLYINFESDQTNIGDGSIDFFAYIPEDDFVMEKVSELFVKTKESDSLTAYSEEYKEHLAPIKASLKELGAVTMESEIRKLWFVLDRDANPGYAGYGDDAERIGAVAKVFPLFFFLVAALVCLTTMTRMVEEERAEIGSLKALGYNTLTISSKYLYYALLSSLFGALLGLSIGFWLFPNAIMNAYAIMYKIPARLTPYHLDYAIISIALAVTTTVSATMLATLQELRSTPAVLIQPKASKPGKRIFFERITPLWKKLTFIHKVTARNIFRYKRRFLMTVIGISGCTALLVTGFGLKDSINDIMDKQFDEIFLYDGQVMLDTEKDKSEKDLQQILGDNKDVQSYIQTFSESGDALVKSSDKGYKVNILVPGDTGRFKAFISLHERESRKEIELPSDGAVITEKLSQLLNLKVGDTFTYKSPDNETYEIKIKAITENYLSHYIFISPEYLKEISSNAPAYNSAMFNLKSSAKTGGNASDEGSFDERAFSEALMNNSGVLGVMLTGSLADEVRDSMDSLNYVVMILIISAGALAFVVLYNLTNINITERIREIATIKVLGFRDKEVSAYVYRENMILTVIGTLFGLLFGVLLHKYVIDTMEIDTMMFGRNVHFISYLLSIVLTMVFSVLVNFFMYYKLKNVNMVESLKSIE